MLSQGELRAFAETADGKPLMKLFEESGWKSVWDRMDTNQDGKVSRQEFGEANFIQWYYAKAAAEAPAAEAEAAEASENGNARLQAQELKSELESSERVAEAEAAEASENGNARLQAQELKSELESSERVAEAEAPAGEAKAANVAEAEAEGVGA